MGTTIAEREAQATVRIRVTKGMAHLTKLSADWGGPVVCIALTEAGTFDRSMTDVDEMRDDAENIRRFMRTQGLGDEMRSVNGIIDRFVSNATYARYLVCKSVR